MSKIVSAIKTFVADENGVTAIEYGLIAALVGVAIVGAAGLLGKQLQTTFTTVTNAMAGK